MCLYINRDNLSTRKTSRAPRGKSIRVFKLLNADGRSEYYSELYTRGELKTVAAFKSDTMFNGSTEPFTVNIPAGATTVGQGLHAYTSLEEAQRAMRLDIFRRARIIVECFIPRRTLYMLGKDLGWSPCTVSLQLRVGRAIDGNPEAMEAFNARRAEKKPVPRVIDKLAAKHERADRKARDAKRKSKTSYKLRKLATAIEQIGEDFHQMWVERCVIGIGLRLQPNGSLSPNPSINDLLDDRYAGVFDRKFGVTQAEQEKLYIGRFSAIDERLTSNGAFDGGTQAA